MEAKEEGVRFEVLSAPEAFAGDGKLEKVVCARMEIGEKDAKGRRTTHKANEAPYEIPADVAIVAVSQYSDFPFISKEEVEMSEWGKLNTDEDMMTSIPGVFAGGDVMRGSATAIRAIADGKIVARSICKYLGLNAGINQGADVDRPDNDEIFHIKTA